MASSESLIDALQRGARYSSIINEGVAQKCTNGSDLSVLLYYVGVSRHLDRHQIEFWMTALVRACRQLTGLRLLPSRLRLTHFRERRCADFPEYFGDNIEFGAAVDEITFAKSVGHQTIVGADP